MLLTVPTDFEILQELADGKRNNAVNLAAETGHDRAYINTRLSVLADYGLVERVGPAPKSGLYVITDRGKLVAAHQEQYEANKNDFDAFIDDLLADS